mgnify:CR=1 FL=1
MEVTKVCVDCSKELLIDRFYVSKLNKGGRATCCKACSALRNKISSSKKDQNELREQRKAYKTKHREELKVKAKARRVLKRVAMTAEQLAEFRRKRLEGKRIHRARKYGSGGRHSEAQWQQLLILCEHKCVACGTSEDITRDHIVPLSRGGSDDISNIQPLCRACNSAKNKYKIVDYRTGAQITSVEDIKKQKTCPQCNGTFDTIGTKRIFCSKNCTVKYHNAKQTLRRLESEKVNLESTERKNI